MGNRVGKNISLPGGYVSYTEATKQMRLGCLKMDEHGTQFIYIYIGYLDGEDDVRPLDFDDIPIYRISLDHPWFDFLGDDEPGLAYQVLDICSHLMWT